MPIYISPSLLDDISTFIEHLFRNSSNRETILNGAFSGWPGLGTIKFDSSMSGKEFSDQLVYDLQADRLQKLLEHLLENFLGADKRLDVEGFSQRITQEELCYQYNQVLIKKLIALLEPLGKVDWVNLRKLLNSSLPEGNVYRFNADKFPEVADMVGELWDKKDSDGKTHGSLWRLVRNIVRTNILDDGIKAQFRRWLEDVRHHSDRQIPAQSVDASTASEEQHILLIEISGQHTGKNKDANNQYQVRAWLHQENQGVRPKLVFTTRDNETILFEQQSLELAFQDIFNSQEVRGKGISRLEVFLPAEKLLFPIDQLTYKDDLGDCGKWVHNYPVLVRSQERALGVWRDKSVIKDNWHGKWGYIKAEKAKLLHIHDSRVDTQTLKNRLDGNNELACSCLIFPCHNDTEIEQKAIILKRLIYSGLPVVFWFHKEIYKSCDTAHKILQRIREELASRDFVYPENDDDIIRAIKQLPAIITDIRTSDNAREAANTDHIGNNWALLWDNPDPQSLPEPFD